MKLRRIEVRETICRLFQRTRFREVTRKALPVVSFVFRKRLACALQCKPIRQLMDPCLLP
jgi:hypothetical protein